MRRVEPVVQALLLQVLDTVPPRVRPLKIPDPRTDEDRHESDSSKGEMECQPSRESGLGTKEVAKGAARARRGLGQCRTCCH